MPNSNSPARRNRRKPGTDVVYRHCEACGNDYDEEMMRLLKGRPICLLCLNLARERQRMDALERLRNYANEKARTD